MKNGALRAQRPSAAAAWQVRVGARTGLHRSHRGRTRTTVVMNEDACMRFGSVVADVPRRRNTVGYLHLFAELRFRSDF